jgi:hypothetical protein
MFVATLRRTIGALALIATGSASLCQPAPADKEPAKPDVPAEYARLLNLIKPRADESQVEQIPWMGSLWEARAKAAAEGKPIFIWVTGGPPGGC